MKHQPNSCISILYGIMTLKISLLLLFTEIEFSLGGSSPYTSNKYE